MTHGRARRFVSEQLNMLPNAHVQCACQDVQRSTPLLGCLRACLWSLATVTPYKDDTLSLVPHRAPKNLVHRRTPLFGCEGTCGRFTTRAILSHLRPLCSIHVERILVPLHVAVKLLLCCRESRCCRFPECP